MERKQFLDRTLTIALFFLLFAVALTLRLLVIVLTRAYSGLRIDIATYVALISLSLSILTIYLLYPLLSRIGFVALLNVKSIYSEWKLQTPLNKILSLSGVISLIITLISAIDWLALLSQRFNEVFSNQGMLPDQIIDISAK